MGTDDIKAQVGELIAARMAAMQITDAELARRLKTSRQNVGTWRKGKNLPRHPMASRLAEALDLPLSTISPDPSPVNVAESRLSRQTVRDVPRIDWVDAGKGLPATDPYPMGHGRDVVQITFDASDGTFALDVRGDSMEPRFSEGDVLIVDPVVTPWSDCFVIAELLAPSDEPGSGDKTFKQYRPRGVIDNGEVFDLVPLNPAYPTITVNRDKPGRVIGVVVGRQEHFTRR